MDKPTKLSEDEIKAIRARRDAVKGPFFHYDEESGVRADDAVIYGPDGDGVATAYGNLAYDVDETQQAAFFAHSWDDISNLLATLSAKDAELERQAKRIKELEEALQVYADRRSWFDCWEWDRIGKDRIGGWEVAAKALETKEGNDG